jgi:methyl-accepting chemotaxis protein
MNAFREMTMKSRLVIGFGVITAMVIVVSVLALQSLSNANKEFVRYISEINHRADLATQIRTAVDRRAIAARNLVLVKSADAMQVERAEVTESDHDVQERLKQLQDLIAKSSDVSDEAKKMVAEIARVESEYGVVARAIVNDALNGETDKATDAIEQLCRPLLVQLIRATENFAEYTRNYADSMIEQNNADYVEQMRLLAIICCAALLIAVLSGILITRALTRTLGAEPVALGGITRRVADGDLRLVRGADTAPDGSVLASMGHMQESLVSLIGKVTHSADSIVMGASQIAAGNSDLSSRTEQQASALQETTSTMEELTAAVRQNANNAQQARMLVDTAADVAQKGSKVVGSVVDTMHDISERSTQIAEITGIIEGIAFQTNILALNAAVEAARAGEQGRGFAVVASEVRSLAQRSSSAALEIKELIGTSVDKIKQGSDLAAQAGSTMAEVTSSVARVTDIMGDIAAASEEQSRDIIQINQTMAQIDRVTQQNAALVEEAAAASQSLEEQGKQLTEMVRFFRVPGINAPEDGAMVFASSHSLPVAVSSPASATPSAPRLPAKTAVPAPVVVKRSPVNISGDEWESF